MLVRILTVIVGVANCTKPRSGYNRANQSFVIRTMGPSVHQVMFGPMNNCEEFFLFKESDDMDSLVEDAKKTNIVSCAQTEEAGGVIDAYDIQADVVCSRGSSRRSMAIDCMIGDSVFGGFVIYIDSEPGCEIADAVARCGGAFLKFRDFSQKVADDSENGNSSDGGNDTVEVESETVEESGEEAQQADDPSETMEETQPTEETTESTSDGFEETQSVDVSTDSADSSNPDENSNPILTQEASSVNETVPTADDSTEPL